MTTNFNICICTRRYALYTEYTQSEHFLTVVSKYDHFNVVHIVAYIPYMHRNINIYMTIHVLNIHAYWEVRYWVSYNWAVYVNIVLYSCTYQWAAHHFLSYAQHVVRLITCRCGRRSDVYAGNARQPLPGRRLHGSHGLRLAHLGRQLTSHHHVSSTRRWRTYECMLRPYKSPCV